MTLTVKCPQCAKPVPWSPQARFKPFCSERCKLIDLGSWAAGEHAIPGAPVDPDMLPDGEDGKLNG